MNKAIIHNPIIWSDVPDVDVIRVNDTYYMVSTSMHTMPGCPIMKSKDLAHWELVNYVFSTLEECDAHELADGKGIYGQGSWAASLKYYNGCFYVAFSCNDRKRFYVYQTEDIENGKWNRTVIEELFHDPALFFEDDGTPYVIYGCGDIQIVELGKDMSGIKEGGINRLLLQTPKENIGLRCEGGHAYKRNGFYYLIFIEWPQNENGRRREICYRSSELLGPYERKIILDDDMGYQNQGVAQGCIFDTLDGDWYAMLFQDHHAVGRIPYVLPVSWEEDWPMIGENGKVPETFEVNMEEWEATPLVISDEFNYGENKLARNWQWNHNPDNRLWSFTERPGYLRLQTGYLNQGGVLQARNTLTQRTEGPSCEAVIRMETGGMKPGDCAGLVALQGNFGLVGIRKQESSSKVVMCVNGDGYQEEEIEAVDWKKDGIYLKIHFDFENSIDRAYFFYSQDGIRWKQIGRSLHMKYTLDHFMGYRIGLFHYATEETGGYTDYEFFVYNRFEG